MSSQKPSSQNVSAAATQPARAIEHNPLFMMERGLQPVSELPRHKRSAATGNLFFEYAQNVPSLRGVVRSGRQIAEYLESKNLIAWDREGDRYVWNQEPLTKTEFLHMLRGGKAAANG